MAEEMFPVLDANRRGPVWWSKAEEAIHTFVTSTLELDAQQVIWEQQGVTRPRLPFVTLLRSAVVSEGGPDETRHKYVEADDELEVRTLQNRVFTLSLKPQADRNCGPDDDAMAMVERLRSALYTESGRAILDRGGLAVVSEEGVTDISQVVNSTWVSRASLDVRLRVWAITSERSGFIERVDVASDGLAPPVSVVVDSPASS